MNRFYFEKNDKKKISKKNSKLKKIRSIRQSKKRYSFSVLQGKKKWDILPIKHDKTG